MEAHFLQLDASNVKRLLVRRDEESVKVDQVFSGQFCLVLKKKENDEGVCSFFGVDDDDLHSLLV